GECPGAKRAGTTVASVTGLAPSLTLLAIWTIPSGDAGQIVLSRLGQCGLSASFWFSSVHPLGGKTTDWRAGCGKSARPVRREGKPNPIGSPYPYRHFPLSVKLREESRSVLQGVWAWPGERNDRARSRFSRRGRQENGIGNDSGGRR